MVLGLRTQGRRQPSAPDWSKKIPTSFVSKTKHKNKKTQNKQKHQKVGRRNTTLLLLGLLSFNMALLLLI